MNNCYENINLIISNKFLSIINLTINLIFFQCLGAYKKYGISNKVFILSLSNRKNNQNSAVHHQHGMLSRYLISIFIYIDKY